MQIPVDKQKHLAVGFMISLLALWFNPFVVFGLVLLAGIGKEVYDSFGNGTVDVMDAVFTAVGGLPLCLLMLFI